MMVPQSHVRRLGTAPSVALLASVIAFALVSTGIACGDGRRDVGGGAGFFDEASVPRCAERCSIDGRAVVTVCDGRETSRAPCSEETACGAGRCQEPCAAAQADRVSNGCEFYFQAPRYSKQYYQSCYAAFVVNTSNRPATVSLEHQGKTLDISKSLYRTMPGTPDLTIHTGALAPGDAAILFISDRDRGGAGPAVDILNFDVPCPFGIVTASQIDTIPDGTGVGTSFHLKANVPVSLASIYPFAASASKLPAATLHLPVSAWAKQHYLISGWEASFAGAPAALIVAAEDDTELTITPRADVQSGGSFGGALKGMPTKFTLGKGQNLQFVQAKELTGSTVTANKPISTYAGHSCATIPTDLYACDYLTQQIPAIEQWGSEYVGVGYRPRGGNEHEPMAYRIVAAQDGTQLDYDPPEPPPGAPTTLSAGESVTFFTGTGDAFVVRTQDVDHPIYVGAYMSGGSPFGGAGDPELVNVIPSGQFLSSYAFYADPTYQETSLVIVRQKSGGRFDDVWLECAGNLSNFRPIGTRGDYEFVRVDLARNFGPGDRFEGSVCQLGMQRMRSEGAFSATLWGWGSYASYAYAGGMALRKLVESPFVLR